MPLPHWRATFFILDNLKLDITLNSQRNLANNTSFFVKINSSLESSKLLNFILIFVLIMLKCFRLEAATLNYMVLSRGQINFCQLEETCFSKLNNGESIISPYNTLKTLKLSQ